MRDVGGRLALGVLVMLACNRSTGVAPTTTVPVEAAVDTVFEASFLEASGRGASEDEAYVVARLELAKALLGDPAWLEVVPLEIHDRGTDPFSAQTQDDGMWHVRVGLTRARVATILSAFTETQLRVDGPAAWRETLTTFFLAHVAATACERRQDLFGSDCEATDTAEADAALAELASGLSLVPAHLGGVPLDLEQRPLRAPGAYVLWRGVPAKGVPLVARWPEETEAEAMLGRSDARGHAGFERSGEHPFAGAASIAVDARALLGPLSGRFPEVSVSVVGRATDLRRWGAVVVERGRDAATPSGPVLEGLSEQLRGRGVGKPVAIPEKHQRVIARDKAKGLGDHMTTMADALGGRVDVVFVVEVDSRFASRMGGGRVWYEARGTLDAYDTWSGRLLASLQTSAKASGLGNERADEASRRALGEALADLVLGSPEIPKPPAGQDVAMRSGRAGHQPANVEYSHGSDTSSR
jgi:hypothetical protein